MGRVADAPASKRLVQPTLSRFFGKATPAEVPATAPPRAPRVPEVVEVVDEPSDGGEDFTPPALKRPVSVGVASKRVRRALPASVLAAINSDGDGAAGSGSANDDDDADETNFALDGTGQAMQMDEPGKAMKKKGASSPRKRKRIDTVVQPTKTIPARDNIAAAAKKHKRELKDVKVLHAAAEGFGASFAVHSTLTPLEEQ